MSRTSEKEPKGSTKNVAKPGRRKTRGGAATRLAKPRADKSSGGPKPGKPDRGRGLRAKPSAREAVGAKPKRISALGAAAQVLKSSRQPLRCQDIVTAMAEQGLWTSPAGKTPAATLHAAIQREIATKGRAARFKRIDRGQFTFNADHK